jgi:tryptophan synthase beta chain
LPDDDIAGRRGASTRAGFRAVVDVAEECKRSGRDATIVFCYSGHGLLDLDVYSRYNAGLLRDVDEEYHAAPGLAVLRA